MKKSAILVLVSGLTLAACQNNPEARYLDLNTGEYMAMKKDSVSGQMVNAQTGKPVDVYVDTQTHDTIWGPSGEVVNGRVVNTGTSTKTHWEVRNQSGSTSTSVESSPDKVKIEDGEVKVKDGDYTKKVDKDGDVKIETGNKTIKIDGETGERKVKKDHNLTDKIKKVF